MTALAGYGLKLRNNHQSPEAEAPPEGYFGDKLGAKAACRPQNTL